MEEKLSFKLKNINEKIKIKNFDERRTIYKKTMI